MPQKINITRTDRFLAKVFLPLIPKWVTPNHITIFRFVTAPFVIGLFLFEYYAVGVVLFAVSAFSDAIDGALARTTDQITDWGKFFDPLADKLLIGGTAIILIPKFLSVYLAIAIVALELIIVLNAYYRKHYMHITIEAHKSGKAKMIFQSVGMLLIVAYIFVPYAPLLVVAEYTFYIAIIFAIISVCIYSSA